MREEGREEERGGGERRRRGEEEKRRRERGGERGGGGGGGEGRRYTVFIRAVQRNVLVLWRALNSTNENNQKEKKKKKKEKELTRYKNQKERKKKKREDRLRYLRFGTIESTATTTRISLLVEYRDEGAEGKRKGEGTGESWKASFVRFRVFLYWSARLEAAGEGEGERVEVGVSALSSTLPTIDITRSEAIPTFRC